MKKLYFILVMLVVVQARAQIIDFPDPAFKEFLVLTGYETPEDNTHTFNQTVDSRRFGTHGHQIAN